MIYLLDTSTISLLMREDPRVESRLRLVSQENSLVTCAFVVGEIRYGIAKLAPGRRRSELESKAGAILEVVASPAISPHVGEHYASLRITAEARGVALGNNDLWIAATALTLGAVLVTSDADFRRLPLQVEDWTQPIRPASASA